MKLTCNARWAFGRKPGHAAARFRLFGVQLSAGQGAGRISVILTSS